MSLDRNIVIEASAGTGKTYTLVQTILQALFEKNLPIDSLVALTFTKKAAGEMKERIAAELQKIDSVDTLEDAWRSWGHGLPELKTRAREALETIDRAAIGTIHSYCFSLLKNFPLAAGISPEAEVDDKGIQSDDLFENAWPAWLRAELKEPRAKGEGASAEWLEVLKKISLKDIGELARRLCDFDVPLDCLPTGSVEKSENGDRILSLLTRLLKPFVSQFRADLLAQGYLSNNALLVLARDLVAGNRGVRETLKRDISMIFVDEFQDTDPLQGELLLFLAEKRGGQATRWQDVQLEPGKLFIVGDPKQSIYRFRGADIAAYQGISTLVLAQGGERRNLEESYRSHDQIIHLVNAAFESLIQAKHPISPAYQALTPRRRKEDPDKHLVELRLAAASEPQSSDDALEREAEAAAAWIAAAQSAKRWTYRDIALVFRSTPPMTPFIDHLRARHIPFVVEGERYFYRTPEVTDVLNLLRVLEDPGNRIALAGFLRSPLGGFTDVELALLQSKNGLLLGKPLPRELNSPAHQGAWNLMRRLETLTRRQPLKTILSRVYEDTYLLELAARSYHQDQTIANLLKLKRLMESFAEEGETTPRGLLSKIDRFEENDKLEGESPLADETYDAIRLLTIHKAKGLEFPVVWLPGLHRGQQRNRRSGGVGVRHDWSTHRLGLSVTKDLRNSDDLVLEEEARAREEAEERRILYVAMTRARDHLILSGGISLKRPSKDSFLNQLAGAWRLDLDSLPDGEVKIGKSMLAVSRISGLPTHPLSSSEQPSSWLEALRPAQFAQEWREREAACQKALETSLVITPSQIASSTRSSEPEDLAPRQGDGNIPSPSHVKGLGILVHRFLEQWDFTCEKCSMPAQLRRVANSYFAQQGLLRTPFPDPKTTTPTYEISDPMYELAQWIEEAQRILADFIDSEAYQEIQGATIIGREIPFFYRPTQGLLMRGTMDIVYRLKSGELIIGDYKTDRLTNPSAMATHSDLYRAQGQVYQEAIQKALGEAPIFKLIYLRDGTAMPLLQSVQR